MKKIFAGIITAIVLIFTPFITSSTHAAVKIPVLEYHYIRNYTYPGDALGHRLSVSIPDFDSQMNYLQTNGYIPIDLNTAVAITQGHAESPAKPVVLTFDDGTIDFYANAYPILKKHGFHATSFVITGFVGGPAYLSWNNIHEMNNSGLISFESHTVNHKSLPGLSANQMYNELYNSKQILQQETGKIVNFIAYPFGYSNSTVWQQARRVGYIGGLGQWHGFMQGASMNMPRIRVNGGESLQVFASHL